MGSLKIKEKSSNNLIDLEIFMDNIKMAKLNFNYKLLIFYFVIKSSKIKVLLKKLLKKKK